MLNPVASFFVYFCEMLISYLFFSKIVERRISSWLAFLLGTLCFESAAVANLLFSNTIWINLISFCTVNLIFVMLCFRIKISIAAFYSFVLTALMSALEIFTIFIFSVILGRTTSSYNSDFILLIIEAIVSKSLYFLTCIILTNFIIQGKSQRKFPLGFYVYPVGTFICLTFFWYICANQELTYINQCLLAISSVIQFCATIIMFLTYQHSMEQENEYIQVKHENDRLQTEKSYYAVLERQNEQLMLYAHDVKNHLNCIRSLNTDYRVSCYIENILDQLTRYTNHCQSGNQILDVIISKYADTCELKGIRFEYDVRLCNLSQIDDFDLVAILGNLLDNAETAAEQSLRKELSIATAIRNSYYVIVIENSCDTVPIFQGDKLFTTKDDGRFHGFGLKSVAKTLRKYKGDFDWEYDYTSNRFITTVMLEKKE